MPIKRLSPIALLCMAFLAMLLTITAVFRSRIPGAPVVALRYVLVIAAVASASFAHKKRPSGGAFFYIDFFMTLFVVFFTFDSLSGLTHYVNPDGMDAMLARLDASIVGYAPGGPWEALINAPLTTVLQLCYASYYFVPVVFCVLLLVRGDMHRTRLAVFGIVFGFFVSYIGYMLVPALGPRYFFHGRYATDLMRGPLASGIDYVLNLLEGENWDAFPSGHTEVVLIVLIYAWRYTRKFFWTALAPVTGLIAATVYLRYHYVVDVVAGAALAPVCVWAADKIFLPLEAITGGSGASPSQTRKRAG